MDPFDRDQFYQVLQSYAKTEEFQWCLSLAAQLTPDDTLITLGNSLEAHRSVVISIACFANAPDSYVRAISHVVSMGDDTDTLAAMAGAIAGARLAIRSVPEHLLALLEDEHKGRSYIELLAADLHGKVARA